MLLLVQTREIEWRPPYTSMYTCWFTFKPVIWWSINNLY